MPWTKLEPDISGVCRITGTRRDDLVAGERREHEDVKGHEARQRSSEIHDAINLRRPFWRLRA